MAADGLIIQYVLGVTHSLTDGTLDRCTIGLYLAGLVHVIKWLIKPGIYCLLDVLRRGFSGSLSGGLQHNLAFAEPNMSGEGTSCSRVRGHVQVEGGKIPAQRP